MREFSCAPGLFTDSLWTWARGMICCCCPSRRPPTVFGRRFDAEENGLPFVVYFYVDEHIAAAKGRGGGWAYWRRMSAAEELQRGFV